MPRKRAPDRIPFRFMLDRDVRQELETLIPWGYQNDIFSLMTRELVKAMRDPEKLTDILRKTTEYTLKAGDFTDILDPIPEPELGNAAQTEIDVDDSGCEVEDKDSGVHI